MKVTILGCGPAGLMAAHGALSAAEMNHCDIELQVISRKVKSSLYGCQYLHAPIPGAPKVKAAQVSYRLRGTVDGYRTKVYGPKFYGTVSPEDLSSDHQAWDIRATYDWLWKRYQFLIIDGEVGPRTVWSLGDEQIIINSIPRDALCHQGHNFGSTSIVAAGDAPDLGIRISDQYQCDDDSVVCNGEETPRWYRMSRVFNHTTVEWPDGVAVPIESAAVVRKPTETDCNCHPYLHHVGRYGRWQKGVLSHTAYFDAFRAVAQAFGEEGHAAAEAGS